MLPPGRGRQKALTQGLYIETQCRSTVGESSNKAVISFVPNTLKRWEAAYLNGDQCHKHLSLVGTQEGEVKEQV